MNSTQKRAVLEHIVKKELRGMVEEASKNENKIATKLETIRKNLIKDGKINLQEKGSGTVTKGSLAERRIPLQTVSELIDVPINELILHFLNGHRIKEGNELVEYRLGCVYFYGVEKDGKLE